MTYQTKLINIKETCPNLYALSIKKVRVVNKRKSHIRFTKAADEELKTMIEQCNGDNLKIMEVYESIKFYCGPDFKKKCRDHYNAYIAKQSTFTEEEDKIVVNDYNMGWKWHHIAEKLHRKPSKIIQNRYQHLMAKKNRSKMFSNKKKNPFVLPELGTTKQDNQLMDENNDNPIQMNESTFFDPFDEIIEPNLFEIDNQFGAY